METQSNGLIYDNDFYNILQYDESSSVSVSMSPNSVISSSSSLSMMSPPPQRVPQLDMYQHNFENSNLLKIPYMKIVEEPCEMFRFRYKSEMSGMHGSLCGRSRKKTYPSVQLHNYHEEAKIYCTLVQVDNKSEVHPHRLVVWKDNIEVDDPHMLTVNPDIGYLASFQGMSILYTAKKCISEELMKKKIRNNHNSSLMMDRELRSECERVARNINLNSVCLRFEAYNAQGNMICQPVCSESIDNSKSAETCLLKITNISRVAGSCRGGDTVFMFVEKVNKKNIKIRFFEIDTVTNGRKWESYGVFSELDVHHQYGIVFKTPPYNNTNITEDVNVFIELFRPKDCATSEEVQFCYKAMPRQNKRRRIEEESSQIFTNMFNDPASLPLTVEAMNDNMRLEHPQKHSETYPSINNNICLDTDWLALLDSNLINEDLPGIFSNTESLVTDSITNHENKIKTEIMSEDKVATPKKNIIINKKKDEESFKNYKNFSEEDFKKLKTIVQCVMNESGGIKKVKILLELLENGRLRNGENLLHMCVTIDEMRYLKELLDFINRNDSGDIMNNVNNQGETPLHRAINFMKPEATSLLLAAGCNPNISDQNGNSALHLSIMNDSEGCMIHLLNHNKGNNIKTAVDLDICNNEGLTPLHLAVIRGESGHIVRLIQAGARTDIKCKTDGRTILHLAVENGHVGLIDALIDVNKGQINDPTLAGCTVLHSACFMDDIHSPKICERLLMNGADLTVKYDKKSPLDVAKENNNKNLIEVLSKYALKNKNSDTNEINNLFNKNLHVQVKIENEPVKFKCEEAMNIASEILDHSGKWHEIAVELGYDGIVATCSEASSPSKMLLNAIEMEERVSIHDFYELIVKLGITDLAGIIKDITD